MSARVRDLEATHIEPASQGQVVQYGRAVVEHGGQFAVRKVERDRGRGPAWRDCGPYEWRGEPVVCKSWRAAMLASAY